MNSHSQDQPQPESIGFECSQCGALPMFSRRVSWGFNMADAYCPNGCKHSFRARVQS